MLSAELGVYVILPLVTQIESGDVPDCESFAVVIRSRFDSVVVDSDTTVRVAESHVEGEIILEGVVCGGEIELGEGSVVDVEFGDVGPED